jgi:lysophospholipid acyltransferase (LPLAT)-like uncharacterized protein
MDDMETSAPALLHRLAAQTQTPADTAWTERLGRGALALLAAGYIRLLGLTSRITWYGRPRVPRGPFIYAFWHNRLLFLVYSHRGRNIHVLVSKSKDGELIASAIRRFGFGAIRGSSSRSAREAAIHTIRALRAGTICAVTPDGPKGPAGTVKNGLSYIARKTGRPVVPVAYAARRKIFLHSWDRFLFPLPFNSIVVLTGRPVYVLPGEDIVEANLRIAAALDKVTAAADRLTGGPRRPIPLRPAIRLVHKEPALTSSRS